MADDFVIYKDLIRIICYPTRFTFKYVNSLYKFLDEKNIGDYREFIYNGALISLNIYTSDKKSIYKSLDDVLDKVLKCGLRCGMMVIPSNQYTGFWKRNVSGFLPDDNDYYHDG